jgi:hypothetical protein
LFSGDSDHDQYFQSPSIDENDEVCFGTNLAENFFSGQQQHLMNAAIPSREFS